MHDCILKNVYANILEFPYYSVQNAIEIKVYRIFPLETIYLDIEKVS